MDLQDSALSGLRDLLDQIRAREETRALEAASEARKALRVQLDDIRRETAAETARAVQEGLGDLEERVSGTRRDQDSVLGLVARSPSLLPGGRARSAATHAAFPAGAPSQITLFCLFPAAL